MAARVREVIDQIVTVLDNNISDPNSRRANDGKTWIFDHFPKYSNKNTLPRIGVHKVTTQYPAKGISQGVDKRTESDIQISIFVREGDKYDFDNDGTNEPEEDLLDYLARQVKTTIENNHDQLIDPNLADVKHVLLNSSNIVRPQQENWMFEALTYEVRIGG